MGFLGEYEVKVDAKGRIKLPAALKKQLHPSAQGKFVVNRGFEKCLTLYPHNEWEVVSAKVSRLNTFEKKKREFVRFFLRGATEVVLDNIDRLNLPNHLLEYADVKDECLLTAANNKLEIWNKARG